MKKLKCWKKIERSRAGGVDTTFYLKKNNKEQIRIIGETPKGTYFVAREIFRPFKMTKLRGSEKTNRDEALSFAEKFMGEHDTC